MVNSYRKCSLNFFVCVCVCVCVVVLFHRYILSLQQLRGSVVLLELPSCPSAIIRMSFFSL